LPGSQLRFEVEELAGLLSIRDRGVIQPPEVRPVLRERI
jgi:hypothetical protein